MMTFPIELADHNLAESLREFTRWSATAQISEQDGVLLTLGADAFPGINDVMRVGRGTTVGAEALLARASAHFGAQGRGFGIRARAHLDEDLIGLCKARKLYLIGDSPGMGVTRKLLPTALPALASSFELRVAADARGIAEFAQVCGASYATMGLPACVAEKVFALPERLLSAHIRVVVAYRDGLPVSAALAFLSHGMGGVYWVGTVPQARKQGVAAHCAYAVTNWCFEQGAHAVTLQASKQGEPIYRALGFAEFTRYPWYLHPGR